MVERGDVLPAIGVAGDALGQARPGVAVMRQHDDVERVVGAERRAQFGRHLRDGDGFGEVGCAEEDRNVDSDEPHPPLTHGGIVAQLPVARCRPLPVDSARLELATGNW